MLGICDWAVFGILLAAYTAVTFYLFYHQSIGNENWFHSDVKAYILEMQGLDSGYDFPYPIFFKLGAFFDFFLSPEMAITIALTILNSGAVAVMKVYLNRQFVKEDGYISHFILSGSEKGRKSRNGLEAGNEGEEENRSEIGSGREANRELAIQLLLRIVLSGLTLTLFFVSMLFSITGRHLPGIEYRYKGVFSPNPYHNATYMATRPFAIICFFMFADILQNYEKKFSWKKGILFGLFLLLTTMTKPSFTFVLVGTAGLIMLYRLIRSRFSNIRPTIFLGLMFLPTFCDLLYQFFGVFGPKEGEETGVGFGWLTAWQYHSGNIPLAVLLGLAFPILVLIIHYKELKTDNVYRFSVQVAGMGLIMALVLYEKGFRLPDMNFSWGYMHGMFFAFVGAAIVLLRSTVMKTKRWYLLSLEWLLYLWHLGCGLLYFKNSLAGYLYY